MSGRGLSNARRACARGERGATDQPGGDTGSGQRDDAVRLCNESQERFVLALEAHRLTISPACASASAARMRGRLTTADDPWWSARRERAAVTCR